MNELLNALNEYKSLGIDEQLDYEKFYLYSIITHSTAIEGSTITEIENQVLFDKGITTNKPLIEQLMNIDLKKAYEIAFECTTKHCDFTIERLCNLSSVVMKNTGSTYNTMNGEFSSSNGDLRLLNVSAGIGGKSYMSWEKIPEKLREFCLWLNNERNKIIKVKNVDIIKTYELSFEAHYRLVTIHPWADGNGRMSRLVMNMIQREASVMLSIVKKESRAEYIKVLIESEEKHSSKSFIDFMFQEHTLNVKRQIEEYLDK